ncbi:hypothetical protein M6D81_04700 [Paenibacillus sp. J5C_2022]|uniref:hypothetical protein n=1 Tax=Paenibacillus sp. J5C2022 TaxID=2977129 RepID=UPI0021D2AA0E|nr:hypothetical protein [Paenibacillus sp. J5C2022]MCU6708005.1 hypothetical protein [Paenibacillus sp. J5C2022]
MAVQFSYIKRALNNSIKEFLDRDKYLLEKNVSERAISHKIASYLEDEFGSFYDVDCEFNRNASNEAELKKILVIHNEIKELPGIKSNPRIHEIDGEEYYEFSVYPDIIVHKRGRSNRNILIIEIKKSNSSITKDYDYCKLKAYTDSKYNDLKYQYGAFLSFNMATMSCSNIEWFKDGKTIELSSFS